MKRCDDCWYENFNDESNTEDNVCSDCFVQNNWIPKGIPLEVLVPPKMEDNRKCKECEVLTNYVEKLENLLEITVRERNECQEMNRKYKNKLSTLYDEITEEI